TNLRRNSEPWAVGAVVPRALFCGNVAKATARDRLRPFRPPHPMDMLAHPDGPLTRRAQRLRGVRRARTARRVIAVALLVAPTLLHVGTDFYRRGKLILAFPDDNPLAYWATAILSLAISLFTVHALARRRGLVPGLIAGVFVLQFTFALGGQQYFFSQYSAYMNEDVSVFASNLMDSIFNQLLADLPNYVRANLPPLIVALLIVFLARRWIRPRRIASRFSSVLALTAMTAACVIPIRHRQIQAATPDILYMNAFGGLVRTQLGLTEQAGQVRPRARESLPVLPLTAKPSRPRNVILVQLESVRADATCVGYGPHCTRTGTTNQLFPNRYPLRQMRSLASSTAICSAALWGGLLPTESREILHTWPLLFDYAKAAGYHTAYFTSQNMLFGNARLWVKNLGVERFLTATDFDPQCDLDMGAPERFLAKRLIQEFNTFKEPFFTVIQLSNVHYPYYIEPNLPQPFQPASLSKAPEDVQLFYNYYLNSIHQQDIHLGKLLGHIRSLDLGKRTVFVYVSDHAESFREHGNLGHTYSVLDSEIHVPAWIDAPPGTLTDSESAALASVENAATTQIDLNATMLDLLGLWEAPEIEQYRARISGDSLLRPERKLRMLPLTNCAGVWSCAFENWGVLHGWRKLEAREWDHQWHCYDLQKDPKEKSDLGAEACPDLVDFAKATFGRLPGANKH
ncbi:MAG TPA: sulfatase-like hydrolase/transferase, partial [Polyangiaceae bacterium]|nr:sulfatase-like hydrolase/transferase [Polyangiaceae bacterium]